MKISVAAVTKDENSEISSLGARAPFYLIFDEKGEFLETIPNPFARGGGGAGFAVAKMLADKGVKSVIAGAFGPNMAGAIEERGLKYYEVSGNAKKVVVEVISR